MAPHAPVLMPRCALCSRPVEAVHIWRVCIDDPPSAVYFHADNERCFVANQADVKVVSHISEIADPR